LENVQVPLKKNLLYDFVSVLQAIERDRRFPFNLRFCIYRENCKKELKAGIFVLWGCLYPLNQANWYWSRRFGNVSFYPSRQANEASTLPFALSGPFRFRTSRESRKDSPARESQRYAIIKRSEFEAAI